LPKTTTVGHLLLNDILPSSHQVKDELSKKQLNKMMVDLAHSSPSLYVRTIGKLKHLGDAVATDEGITVGLDDIEPDYARRDKILEPALAAVKKIRDPHKRNALIEKTQQQMMKVTERHPGQMTPMATSGARGKVAQLMRSVTSPVAVVDDKNNTIPWMISKSYAEGLKAPDAWIAMSEARRNAVETYTSVALPGEINKILVNNMSDQLITMPDCGTKNGLMVDPSEAVDRYAADTGVRITPAMLQRYPRGKKIKVRSPMTCEAPDGICQKCYGLNTNGQIPRLGTNAGMIAAHAMGEPITQMSLDAKHATRTAGSQKAVLTGISGFKQITEIPQSFFNKATLATRSGKITDVVKAPQGGHYVHMDEEKYYVPPNLGVLVKKGAQVDAGDALSDGIPRPDEVVKYKGLGAGRKYLVDQLHGIYERKGIDLDKRHLEILAKTDMNYVRILDKDSGPLGVMRGDVVDYNQFRRSIAEQTKPVALKDAEDETLGDNVLHYTTGTRITPSVMNDMRKNGVKIVPIAPRVPQHEFVIKPASRAPLLHPDLLGKLGHRNLKNVILDGAAFGELSSIHGTHPVPAFVFGEEFGEGPSGRY
jgi:DNA-directed RNA polymerase subunit beta'